ncbi:uncharacterized protein LOC126373281 isoform X1 [Pectinophora gossypiella]|uniref:uncharacterized protein LOC126373281 isoform X1 n=1 Tax=Pectinophora gossypiella TaxID=13191 RepID=UPI00214EB94E|nr:uncharacterized protein LOC126373281 isoform X1 [Pectinophora gossypiella]XP_049875317.1 uncharacterized protein LOC126373281 isoform X1 [Pectinophora gossypiella]
MSAFWRAEKVPEIFPEQVPEQDYCEKLFQETTRLENNKFLVTMPTKVPLEQINSELGDSFNQALQRFINLEKKLQKNPVLFREYKKFIDQYTELKHGEYIDINSYDLSKDPVFFLPHHAVINESSRTTKLRTVFDGSMRTNNKISLNDLLMNGPVVQKELFEILISFRLEAYFFICDIQKMFRCIQLNPSQRSLQNILWRESPEKDILCIQLSTVTYGLKSSSYLATRCLIELATRYKDQFPLASAILINNTYVDDVLVTSKTECELLQMKAELVGLLELGSFYLHKWASNSTALLQTIPVDSRYFGEVELHNDMSVKTLGVSFDVKDDLFKTACPEPYKSTHDTKRDILSYISKFYDPLGLIGPILVRAKVIMQQLWLSETDWDSIPPENVRKMWVDFSHDLSLMEPIKVPRCVTTQGIAVHQLIGFADASSVAYGCCLYLRSIDAQGNIRLELLCSKSRVNPLRKQLTVPRLELNAALLLSELSVKVYNTLIKKINVHDTYLFSDSQIVLAWLKTDATKLQTYVANRVRAIQELTHSCSWQYINTAENPSDCLSRGLQPQELKDHHLWWNGPLFLHNKDYNFQSILDMPTYLPEVKCSDNKVVCNTTTTLDTNVYEKLKKFSNINKMSRVFSYILRFCNNLKKDAVKQTGFLSTAELHKALLLIVKNEQHHFYESEIKCLSNQRQLTGSSLTPLTPFLDGNGILRVGGRLHNASMPYNAKHPAILPKGSEIADLIIRDEHLKLLHAGQKLVLTSLKQRFWLIDGLRTVKKVIHKCVTCFRLKASASAQLMGSLPAERITACRPFQKVGIDFAGPVSVKNSRIRKPIIGKGYIVIFVCFVTKAIHIELASDLTTETFLACFKRFIARRNLPSDVYCDNGATFKGARNQLHDLYRLHTNKVHQDQVCTYASERGISFNFIPSYSPVFGGLWESGVKSAKHHLKRVVGKALLTYEQLNTVLTEIEGVLNSRPLTAVTADPNDFSFLSPGHFLTGAPLNTYPERDVSNTRINLLKFWSIAVNMKQLFWKYWSRNYLNLLQCRPKWRKDMPNVTIGSLVILCNDNTQPLYWPMARITNVFPGKDGKVRAVELQTANGHKHNRSITKICVLPIDCN